MKVKVWHEEYEEYKYCVTIDGDNEAGFKTEEAANNYGERDYIEEAKILIVDKITKHFQNVMFEMVCKEMDNNYMFRSDNYLTEAGYEMFEDEWFEFYHEHHGDILYEVMKNITN